MSAASTWEIATKSSIGKIKADLSEVIASCTEMGFSELPVRMLHCTKLMDLPPLHKDPFDRILAAQSLEEGLTMVSQDPIFGEYGVTIFWR